MVRAVTSTIIATPARVASARICRIEQSLSESDTVTNDEIEYGSNNGKDNDINKDEDANDEDKDAGKEGEDVNEEDKDTSKEDKDTNKDKGAVLQ